MNFVKKKGSKYKRLIPSILLTWLPLLNRYGYYYPSLDIFNKNVCKANEYIDYNSKTKKSIFCK